MGLKMSGAYFMHGLGAQDSGTRRRLRYPRLPSLDVLLLPLSLLSLEFLGRIEAALGPPVGSLGCKPHTQPQYVAVLDLLSKRQTSCVSQQVALVCLCLLPRLLLRWAT
jgi:hypothetical protein